MRGLRHTTLDIIGKSGFDYDMAAGDSESELSAVFAEIFHGPQAERRMFYRLIRAMVPTLNWLPITPGSLAIARARKKMEDICASILAKSRAESGLKGADKRDLLSIMLKANASAETKKRLDDSELTGQIPTFLVAGHHTTSTALGWALYVLSMHPEIQKKLRAELLGIPSDRPTIDQLNGLPYLELFIREVLRLHSPVAAVSRMSAADCAIPLAEP
ncbi:unnamed protein product [Mycena citricolor]|uniref:Cytochrome P450 n=1 Tax=Mycena citricolor TaxID=2018698 RepID=A0AAD2I0K8_9AGAR|nr:unnamed protein product [Mycena citricolor]